MKNRFCNSFLISLLVVMATSCATISNITVSNVNNTDALQTGSMVYALPQTVLDISVVAEEVTVIPGPYEKYAEKYLGIKAVPVKTEKIYNLKQIKLFKHLEADPDFIYSVSGVSDPTQFAGFMNLIKDSLVLSASDFSGNLVNSYSWPVKSNEVLYTDLSIKRNFEAEKDIEISMVMPDTNYAVRPAGKTILKEKTLEQKAEEAANFLIKLKKRRFKLVAGQYEYMPDGESMAEALRELGRLEDEYLSLFMGKRLVTEIHRNYHYTPAAGADNNRIVLFRFSPSEGFVDARESAGIPVMLQMEAGQKIKSFRDYRPPLKPAVNEIPYRIADQVNIKLLAGEQVWVEAIYPVFQYGVNISMRIY